MHEWMNNGGIIITSFNKSLVALKALPHWIEPVAGSSLQWIAPDTPSWFAPDTPSWFRQVSSLLGFPEEMGAKSPFLMHIDGYEVCAKMLLIPSFCFLNKEGATFCLKTDSLWPVHIETLNTSDISYGSTGSLFKGVFPYDWLKLKVLMYTFFWGISGPSSIILKELKTGVYHDMGPLILFTSQTTDIWSGAPLNVTWMGFLCNLEAFLPTTKTYTGPLHFCYLWWWQHGSRMQGKAPPIRDCPVNTCIITQTLRNTDLSTNDDSHTAAVVLILLWFSELVFCLHVPCFRKAVTRPATTWLMPLYNKKSQTMLMNSSLFDWLKGKKWKDVRNATCLFW